MSGKVLVQIKTPVTQKPDAVEALATYLNKQIEPGVLDLGVVKLIKSNKGDAFYTVTAKVCSCPAATYHPGQPCKHQRKHFPQEQVATAAEPSSIRPEGKWLGNLNGPVDSIAGEEKVRASSSLSIIDCHDTSDKDAAYWSIQEDKIMWPAEA